MFILVLFAVLTIIVPGFKLAYNITTDKQEPKNLQSIYLALVVATSILILLEVMNR